MIRAMNPITPTEMVRIERGVSIGNRSDELATEEPLEIRVEGHSVAVVMRTPGHDQELTAGFLLSEGIVKSAKDIFDITGCVGPKNGSKGNVIDVGLTQPANFSPAKFTRHVFTSSSCGVCSKASIEAVMKRHRPLADDVRVSASILLGLPRQLTRAQEAFKRTGGLHACALFDAAGKFVTLREDVGRHNALDKLIGFALLEKKLPLSGHVLLLSGRTSFEMMQKSYAAGIPIVASISAPSSLAVEFARESGQTLAGFVRGRSLNVYAGAERVTSRDRTKRGN